MVIDDAGLSLRHQGMLGSGCAGDRLDDRQHSSRSSTSIVTAVRVSRFAAE